MKIQAQRAKQKTRKKQFFREKMTNLVMTKITIERQLKSFLLLKFKPTTLMRIVHTRTHARDIS